MNALPGGDAYRRLISLLDDHDARYRLIDHEPEGRTEFVSPLRGNELAAAAKCMVVMVKVTKKRKIYVLAVVPGDRRVDLDAVRELHNGRYAGFADPEIAQDLSGCETGTVLPSTWNERLQLVVDPALYDSDELYFNAGRLDRSIALATSDYRRIAAPAGAPISESAPGDTA